MWINKEAVVDGTLALTVSRIQHWFSPLRAINQPGCEMH